MTDENARRMQEIDSMDHSADDRTDQKLIKLMKLSSLQLAGCSVSGAQSCKPNRVSLTL